MLARNQRMPGYRVHDSLRMRAGQGDRHVEHGEARPEDDHRAAPLHHLPGRLSHLPPGPIWVHCQTGYRASVAASILQAAGNEVTAIDDDFSRAADAGLPVTATPQSAPAARRRG
jgi:rhodanese-related sulfurtransferase